MDLDAFVHVHAADWARLDELAGRRRLDGPASDELVERYQQVATHLSSVRTSAPDAALVTHLSSLLARARITMVGTRVTGWRGVLGFFTERFPAALYRLRWWWLSTMAVNVGLIAVLMLWFLHHPTFQQSLIPPAEVDQLVNSDFEGYYHATASSHFALQVWTNNAWVAARCVAFGILGVPVVLLLFFNVLNVAVIGSVMTRAGRAGLFYGLILPHGLLELTAVFVAGGVGLRLFWSWVEPGATSRSTSVARAGRTAVTVALGLVVVLFVSGLLEGFVTPSSLPTWARLAVGVVAEAAFLAYVFVVGRAAARRGVTGDVAAHLLDDTVATRD